MKEKLVIRSAFCLGVFLFCPINLIAETDKSDNPVYDPSPSPAYEPNPAQLKATVALIRKETEDVFENRSKKRDSAAGEDAAAVRQRAGKDGVEFEKFDKALEKACGGEVPGKAFDQAADLVIDKDYDRLNSLYKGKLQPETLRKYVGLLALQYAASRYANKNMVIHIPDEKLAQMKAAGDAEASYNAGQREIAEMVEKNAMDDELDYLNGKVEKKPKADDENIENDDSRVFKVARWLWQNYGQKEQQKARQDVKGQDNKTTGNPFTASGDTVFHGFYLADYRFLTQGKNELEKKKFTAGHLELEGRVNSFYSAYSGYVVIKSFEGLKQIHIDMGKLAEDAAVGVAKDIGANAVKGLLGF